MFRYHSVRHYLEVLETHLGPTREAFRSLGELARKSLAGVLADLASRSNRSGDETIVLPGNRLEVVAIRC